MIKRFSFLLMVFTVALTGCKKYEDGPYMSLYSKGMRVGGTWYFQRVSYGTVDSTANYTYQVLNFAYIKELDGGAFTWNHNLRATYQDDNPLEGGGWRFIADRDSFKMIFYRNEYRDSILVKWKIRRLAFTEFWLERTIKDTTKLNWQLYKSLY